MQVLTLRWDTLGHHSSEGLREPQLQQNRGGGSKQGGEEV